MHLFIITVRDSAADSFHAPLFFPALGMAERWFKDECNSGNPDSQMARHSSDFDLYQLGTYDPVTAELSPEVPRLILRGSDAVRKVNGGLGA